MTQDTPTPEIEQQRAAFEAFMSDDGQFPQAVERDTGGNYVLMQAASSWQVWQAALLDRQQRGKVVVTWDERKTRILMVSRQDADGEILSVIAIVPPDESQPATPAHDMHRAAEAYQIAEQECVDHHSAAGNVIEPAIAVEAGLLAAAPFLAAPAQAVSDEEIDSVIGSCRPYLAHESERQYFHRLIRDALQRLGYGAAQPAASAEPVAEVELWPNDRTPIGLTPLVDLRGLAEGTKLYTAPVAAQPSVQDGARREALLDVIRRLNANPYSLTKRECIDEIEAVLAAAPTLPVDRQEQVTNAGLMEVGFRWRLQATASPAWNYVWDRSPDSWELREAEIQQLMTYATSQPSTSAPMHELAREVGTGLKPCPLCGGSAKEHDRINANTVTCRSCGVTVKQSEMGMGDAADRWNQRATPPADGQAQQDNSKIEADLIAVENGLRMSNADQDALDAIAAGICELRRLRYQAAQQDADSQRKTGGENEI